MTHIYMFLHLFRLPCPDNGVHQKANIFTYCRVHSSTVKLIVSLSIGEPKSLPDT